MNIITKYLIKKYLKYFFIILFSLELFFVGIDLLQQYTSLPNSANLQLLYVIYTAYFALTITLPLSLIFAWVMTLTNLIKDNELVSFYALSISKRKVLRPIVNISTLITFILVGLQMTPLAYSNQEKKKILNNQFFVNERSNIFLKYNEYFIYFKKLYPLEKKAEDIHIFKTLNNDLVEIIVAKKAHYQNNKWYVVDTKITRKPEVINWNSSKLTIEEEKFLFTLEGFEPKIINNVYTTDIQFSIIDAIRTIVLLDDQDFNTNKIKTILYSQAFMPFFAVPLIIFIFIFVTPSSRFFNTATFISISTFVALLFWGIQFLLQKLALGGVVMAEIAIILPLIILFIVSRYIYNTIN